MNVTLVAALIAAAAALVGAGLTFWNGARVARLAHELRREDSVADRRLEAERIVSRFREPLLHAAFDLQSRLFNIAKRSFLGVYLTRGNASESTYAVDNTLFLIGQFFAWREIIRREVQFLDLGEQDRTRRLVELQAAITHAWRTDRYGRLLRVLSGDQRAVGERLICTAPNGRDCIGYAEFCDLLAKEPERVPQLAQLRDDLVELSKMPDPATIRLIKLQIALIDLVDFLDPDALRYGRAWRTKLADVDAAPAANDRPAD